ncbi:hypothetical protein [Oryza sativa Japonica Group]|uniref:Uncharacterized protein n=1 Tax=Oryza sativa subsp. japonica TaxID=39947 RepID=Q5N7Q0_ORYSJ|nr:hypothetical protein [Oryza sativa Japonica Group]BAD82506.1 hypothetical protein [Oryza sativa Japonica Group]
MEKASRCRCGTGLRGVGPAEGQAYEVGGVAFTWAKCIPPDENNLQLLDGGRDSTCDWAVGFGDSATDKVDENAR